MAFTLAYDMAATSDRELLNATIAAGHTAPADVAEHLAESGSLAAFLKSLDEAPGSDEPDWRVAVPDDGELIPIDAMVAPVGGDLDAAEATVTNLQAWAEQMRQGR